VRDWLASSGAAKDLNDVAPLPQLLLEALAEEKPTAKATAALEKEAVAAEARKAAATAAAKAKKLAAAAARAAAVSAAAALAAARGADPAGGQAAEAELAALLALEPRTGAGSDRGRSDSSSVDDAYANAMGEGASVADAAESAQWADAARSGHLPTVGIDLVREARETLRTKLPTTFICSLYDPPPSPLSLHRAPPTACAPFGSRGGPPWS
jgi:hypothetical protein